MNAYSAALYILCTLGFFGFVLLSAWVICAVAAKETPKPGDKK